MLLEGNEEKQKGKNRSAILNIGFRITKNREKRKEVKAERKYYC